MQMFSKFNRKSTSASWFGQQHPGISFPPSLFPLLSPPQSSFSFPAPLPPPRPSQPPWRRCFAYTPQS
ncbi:uncharacterized protein K489DRAFT_383350 [Dissoconium aciculare CBS 342.82]|uniref:Uncharacterized protein n=1 Tax=Dissoconium aciculare CBS 342.82 TaxID=1314786 RepID=A0A6J3LVI9_9PEZI|nr:uncharacterized protein K489DRAFT_383350 [Dissoconium aciculare CBS 342.82]KAF1819780.1 hypothetical protein K489DRAFT_383350 [Dissoconium aciculare CBS 342.82]